MKKLLSIVLSILLLVGMIPASSYAKTEVNQTATTETITTYANAGDKGTYNNPIVMYVGDQIKLKSNVEHDGIINTIKTKWVSEIIFGKEVAAFDANEQTAVNNQETTVTAKSVGNIRIKMQWYNWSNGFKWEDARETKHYFYITVIERPQSAGTNQEAKVNFTKAAEWVNYNEGIAKISLNTSNTETIKGSDIVFLIDKSSSMTNTFATAKKAVANMTQTLLGNPIYNNRVAVVNFAGDINGSFNFRKDLNLTLNGINALSVLADKEANGTNYSLAFQQALNYALSRTETNRPLQIVFLSDGEPTGGNRGTYQFGELKRIAENAKNGSKPRFL